MPFKILIGKYEDIKQNLFPQKTIGDHKLDISKLASGMYLIELSNSAGRTVKKFLKE